MNIDQLKNICKLMLNGYEVYIDLLAERHNCYQVTFTKDFPIDTRSDNKQTTLIEDIKDSILQSELFAARIIKKDEEIDQLKEEIAELERYKTHFDVQMRLNHGER